MFTCTTHQARAEAEKVAAQKAKAEKESAEKRAKAEKEAAEKRAKEEKAAAEKKAKEEKAAADKKAKEEKNAADKKAKEEKEAPKQQAQAEKSSAPSKVCSRACVQMHCEEDSAFVSYPCDSCVFCSPFFLCLYVKAKYMQHVCVYACTRVFM